MNNHFGKGYRSKWWAMVLNGCLSFKTPRVSKVLSIILASCLQLRWSSQNISRAKKTSFFRCVIELFSITLCIYVYYTSWTLYACILNVVAAMLLSSAVRSHFNLSLSHLFMKRRKETSLDRNWTKWERKKNKNDNEECRVPTKRTWQNREWMHEKDVLRTLTT